MSTLRFPSAPAVAARLQMASVLPRGPLVDEFVVEELSQLREVRVEDDNINVTRCPVGLNLSPAAVRKLEFGSRGAEDQDPLRTAVVAGLREPDAVTEVARDGWPAMALLWNTTARRSGLVEAPELGARLLAPWALDTLQVATLPVAADLPDDGLVESLLHLGDPALVAGDLNLFWSWGNQPCDASRLPTPLRDAWVELAEDPVGLRRDLALHVSGVRRNSGRFNHALVLQDAPPMHQLVESLRMMSLPAVKEKPETLGGFAFENPWLEDLVTTAPVPTWKSLLGLGVRTRVLKPVAGRVVGRELFRVTGQDVGLWLLALEMLETWRGTLPEWLEAVEALR